MLNIKFLRKTLCCVFVLFLIVVMSVFNMSTAVMGYVDLSNSHWASTSVDEMSEKDIIKGYPDGTFRPDENVTYAEFIKMMVVAFTGKEEVNATSGHWALNYYNFGLDNSLYLEADLPKSTLDKKIPRGDMAYIISNALGDIAVGNYKDLIAQISDVDTKTQHEYDIIKVYSKNILNGYDDGTFRPKGKLSRAEAAQALYKYTTVKNGGVVENISSSGNISSTETTTKKSITEQIKEEYDWDWMDKDALGMLCKNYKGSKVITDFVSNFNDVGYEYGTDKPIWGNIKYYEILEDCPYRFNVMIDLGGATSIQMRYEDHVFTPFGAEAALVKDGKIMVFEYEYMGDPCGHGSLEKQWIVSDGSRVFYPDMGLNYSYQMPLDFDYLIFWGCLGDTAFAIKNPFLNGEIKYVDLRN